MKSANEFSTRVRESRSNLKRANLRRKWSTIPRAAAFHNHPSRFTAWRLFVSRRVTLTTHHNLIFRQSLGACSLIQSNVVTRKLSLDFRDRAKRTETVFHSQGTNRVFPAFCFLRFEKFPTLGHNLALISVLYSGERPEMISQ